MTSYQITLRMEGCPPHPEQIRLADFAHEIEALRHALTKCEAVLTGRSRLEWQVVGLSYSSPATIVVEPTESDDYSVGISRDVGERFLKYVRTLPEASDIPPELDRPALEAFRRLAHPVQQGRVRAWVSNGESESTEIVGTMEPLIERFLAVEHRTTGSVKGSLEFINVHGDRNVFRIYPPVGPNRVQCYFPKEMLESARSAVGCKVRVIGEVTYLTRDPFPNSIKVEHIAILQDDSDLPSFLELRGMAPDATGDLSSEEFVRQLRSEVEI